MTSKVFSSGTVIDSAWLNDVNNAVYGGGIPGTLPTGGTVGQVPTKNSSTNYDVSWTTLPTTFYNAMQHGVTGNGTTDDTTALQACINYVCTNGGCLYLPKGLYKISAPLTFQCVASADPHKRPSMLGDGIGATVIYQTTNNNGIVVVGDSTDPSTYADFKGFTLYGSALQKDGFSIGDGAFCSLEKVYLAGWDIGLYGVNALSSQFRDVVMRFNNGGFRFEANTSLAFVSEPNALTMEGCTASNNNLYGGYVIGAGTFSYIGGSIESNGSGTDLSSTKWGLHLVNAGGNYSQQAASGFNLQGVYFENNGGQAHLWVDQTVSHTGMSAVVSGCSFSSLGGSYPSSFVYLGASGSSTAFPISFVGCGWAGLSGYTPSAGRPTITNLSDYFKLSLMGCSFYSSVDQYKQGSANRLESAVECVSYRDLSGAVISGGGGGGVSLSVANTWTANQTLNGVEAGTVSSVSALKSTTASLALANTSANAILLNTVGAVTTFAPTVDNAVDLGGGSAAWKTFSLKGVFGWNGYSIPAPAGTTTTFLRNDGTWVNPTASLLSTVNTWTANQSLNGVTVGTVSSVSAVKSTTGSLALANTSANAVLLNTVGATTTFAPTVDNAIDLGGTGATWKTLALKGNMVWNGYSIPAPAGSTSTYLRNDGIWVSPVISFASTSSSSGLALTASGSTGSVSVTLSGTPSAAVDLAGGTLTTSGYTLVSSNNLAVIQNSSGYGVFVNGSSAFAPSLDNSFTLGGSTFRWTTVYATTGTINTSDATQKTPLQALTSAELRVATALAKKVGTYKFLDAVAAKADGARIHVGLIAQQVVACFQEEGLDPFAYGMVCLDNGLYGLRYEELHLFITQGQEARIAALEARL